MLEKFRPFTFEQRIPPVVPSSCSLLSPFSMVTRSAVPCASASRGAGWPGPSTETPRGSWTRTSGRFRVSEVLGFPGELQAELTVPSAGLYFTGDGAFRSEDGFYQITGRMDDIIDISGHWLGTALVRTGSRTRFSGVLQVVDGIQTEMEPVWVQLESWTGSPRPEQNLNK